MSTHIGLDRWLIEQYMQAILADNSFGQPFFVTYVNTLFFILPLPPALVYKAYRQPEEFQEWKREVREGLSYVRAALVRRKTNHAMRHRTRDSTEESGESLLSHEGALSSQSARVRHSTSYSQENLSLAQTAKLSLEFCPLWFLASYFLLACLEHTTVASSTILTSTASGFTLVVGVLLGVEKFTIRKLASVLLSLVGIILISTVDYSGKSSDDEHRGQFPEKSTGELALGNTLALLSALVYAIYIIRMKKRLPDESVVSLPVFFGLVGLANGLLAWPGFFILHWTGLETFVLPAPGRVTFILLLNAVGSMLSDVIWAYAVLLTSPILVTVGLSMTIPLTLVGQMVLNSQTSTAVYWVGAAIVVLSFVIVTHEEKQDDDVRQAD